LLPKQKSSEDRKMSASGKADLDWGQSMSALSQFSDVDLLGYSKRIIHLDP